MRQRLINALVRILQLNVFPNHPDPHMMRRMNHPVHKTPPRRQIRIPPLQPQQLAHPVIQPLLMQLQRHLIDRVLHIPRLDHILNRHVAKQRNLVPHILVQGHLRPRQNDVRPDPDLPQLRDALLRRLRLQLTRRAQIRHQSRVNIQHIPRRLIMTKLTNRLQKRQPLNVTHRPTNLRDDDVPSHLQRHFINPRLDLIRHMRNHLHRAPLILPRPLLLNHRRIHLPARQIVQPRQIRVREPLIMPQIQIRLRPVIQHINLPVLIRVHRARIDVQIGIKLLHDHLEAAIFQQRAK